MQAARDRVRALGEVIPRLQRALALACEAHELAKTELLEAAREDMELRPLGEPARRQRSAQAHVTPEAVRDAVVRLGSFVASELAAELGCSTKAAHGWLRHEHIAKLVRPDGLFGRVQAFAYVEPEGPGGAFEVQQGHAPRGVAEVADLAERRGLNVAQSRLGMIADKELRKVVGKALAMGWEIRHRPGAQHPVSLVHPNADRPIPVWSTPANSENAAATLWRRIKKAS